MYFNWIDIFVVVVLFGVLLYKDISAYNQHVIAGAKYPFSVWAMHLISGYLMPVSLARVWLMVMGFMIWKLMLPGILIDVTLIVASRLIWLCHAVELSLDD